MGPLRCGLGFSAPRGGGGRLALAVVREISICDVIGFVTRIWRHVIGVSVRSDANRVIRIGAAGPGVVNRAGIRCLVVWHSRDIEKEDGNVVCGCLCNDEVFGMIICLPVACFPRHNLHHWSQFFAAIRTAIRDGTLEELAECYECLERGADSGS